MLHKPHNTHHGTSPTLTIDAVSTDKWLSTLPKTVVTEDEATTMVRNVETIYRSTQRNTADRTSNLPSIYFTASELGWCSQYTD